MRQDVLAQRRERKFDKYDIEIVPEKHTEIRVHNKGQENKEWEEVLEFAFAVREKGRLVGRATTHRSALKRAHQACKTASTRRRR